MTVRPRRPSARRGSGRPRPSRRALALACGAAAFCCLLLFDTGALARALWTGLRGPAGIALAVLVLGAGLWRAARRRQPPKRAPRRAAAARKPATAARRNARPASRAGARTAR